jgi:hypothetical protein
MSWYRRRRRQRRDEQFIWTYQFPERIEERCLHHHPELRHEDWPLVEQGLREWFLCCAWRDGEVLGMPSRLVDDAWHEFILDSVAYTRFCEQAFGEYLHHSPEESMPTPMAGALDQTARAWERSGGGDRGDSILWRLDALVAGLAASDAGGGGDSGGGGGGCGGGGCGGGN